MVRELQIGPLSHTSQSYSPTACGRGLLCVNLSVLAAAVIIALLNLTAWRVIPSKACADGFSSENAEAHLRAISAAPRTTGSETHAIARRYLHDFLESRGLSPEIQNALVINTSKVASPIVFVAVENV